MREIILSLVEEAAALATIALFLSTVTLWAGIAGGSI